MKERVAYIDNLRCFACLMVVLDHTVIVGYKFLYAEFSNNFMNYHRVIKCLSVLLWEISRFGVPMFCMLSGSLIIRKDFANKERIKIFYNNNIFPLVTINYIWIVIYWVISYIYTYVGVDYVYNGSEWDFSIKEFVYELLWIHRGHYANIWFIPMIVGMYLFMPIVAEAIKNICEINIRYLLFPLFLSVVILFGYTDINSIFGLTHPFNMTSTIDVSLSGGGIWNIHSNRIFTLKIYQERQKKWSNCDNNVGITFVLFNRIYDLFL